MLETYWSSELSQLQELQKREYREWVTKVHEDMVRVTSGLPLLFMVSLITICTYLMVIKVEETISPSNQSLPELWLFQIANFPRDFRVISFSVPEMLCAQAENDNDNQMFNTINLWLLFTDPSSTSDSFTIGKWVFFALTVELSQRTLSHCSLSTHAHLSRHWDQAIICQKWCCPTANEWDCWNLILKLYNQLN